jgi:hypothetical protein
VTCTRVCSGRGRRRSPIRANRGAVSSVARATLVGHAPVDVGGAGLVETIVVPTGGTHTGVARERGSTISTNPARRHRVGHVSVGATRIHVQAGAQARRRQTPLAGGAYYLVGMRSA